MGVVNLLAADTPLPRRSFDHPLSGEWNDHRDCHIRPDLVLIYRKPDDGSLELVASAHLVSLACDNPRCASESALPPSSACESLPRRAL